MATIPFRINGYEKVSVVVKNNRRGMMRFEYLSMQVSQHSAFTGAYITISVTSVDQGTNQTREILFEYDVENKATRRVTPKYCSIQKIDFIYIQPGESAKFSCFAILNPQEGNPPLQSNWQITGFFDDQFIVLTEETDNNSSVFINRE